MSESHHVLPITHYSFPITHVVHRQQDRKARISRDAFESDRAMMLVDEILGDGKPQSAAVIAPGHQRIEYALADRFGNAGPVVQNLQRNGVAVAFARERDLAGDAGHDTDFALAL